MLLELIQVLRNDARLAKADDAGGAAEIIIRDVISRSDAVSFFAEQAARDGLATSSQVASQTVASSHLRVGFPTSAGRTAA